MPFLYKWYTTPIQTNSTTCFAILENWYQESEKRTIWNTMHFFLDHYDLGGQEFSHYYEICSGELIHNGPCKI